MITPYKNTFIIDEYSEPFNSEKIAAFDLDNSVIKQKDSNNWIIIYGAKNNILKLKKENYKIVFFTYQSSAKFDIDKFKEKAKEIKTSLGAEFQLFGCHGSGYSKKPSIGLWKLLEQNNGNLKINLDKSFYIGDAIGRSNDLNDYDLKFALNIGIKHYTPDEYYDNCKIKTIMPDHPLSLLDNVAEQIDYSIFNSGKQLLVILSGPPSCGKTTWCKQTIFNNYTKIDQENYKIKSKMLIFINETLKSGKNVIINKRNELEKDRLEFISIAKEYNITPIIVCFDIPKKVCKHICAYREIISEREFPSIIVSKYYSNNENKEPNDNKEVIIIRKKFTIDHSLIEDKELFNNYLT